MSKYSKKCQEFLQGNITVLEAVAYYYIKTGKLANRSWKNFFKMIGEDEIYEEDLGELARKVMRERILEDAPNLRLCILSDVIDNKSIDQSFKDICKMIESKYIDYQDFQFWFTRFSSGNWDLDQKTFSDLPVDIIGEIVKYLDLSSQMRLRKVSRGLQDIVFQVKSSVVVAIGYKRWNGNIINNAIVYYEKFRNCIRHDLLLDSASAIPFFLKNPRLHLKYFGWEIESQPLANNGLIELLNSLNHPIEITELRMVHMTKNAMIALLKATKPGTLQKITVSADWAHQTVVNQFVKMDQWKQAKKVTIDGICIDFPLHFHHFHHFESFVISAHSITIDDLLNMRKVFSNKTSFKHCSIKTKNMPPMNVIKKQLRLSNHHKEDRKFSGRWNISFSKDFLEFRIDTNGVSVDRKCTETN
uniref:F-box domain-containing protein n=1 Tax=Caenorhabditis tropicalis TaxID=1561998 RepID=A0A1I7UIA7_9PELO